MNIKKNTKILIYVIFIIIAIIGIFVLIKYTFLSSQNIQQSNGIKLDYSGFFEALAIFLGIISFFIKFIMDIVNNEKQSKQYWFRNYILELNLKKYIRFIENSKEIFRKILNCKEELLEQNPGVQEYIALARDKYYPMTVEFNLEWNEMVSSLNFIEVYNKKFVLELTEIFNEIQDLFTRAVDEEINNLKIKEDSNILNEQLEETKSNILKLFYEKSLE